MSLASATRKRKLICLVGFMGCGKTTVGRRLARQLGWRFVDLDTRIEERAGLRIDEIFDRQGEPAFRELEREQLLHALGEAASKELPTVLALGGGTFAQPENLPALRAAEAIVVWIDCPVEDLLARCATVSNRPLFRDATAFRQLYQQRLPFYQQADFRVENSEDPREVIEQILALGIFEDSTRLPDTSAGRVKA